MDLGKCMLKAFGKFLTRLGGTRACSAWVPQQACASRLHPVSLCSPRKGPGSPRPQSVLTRTCFAVS